MASLKASAAWLSFVLLAAACGDDDDGDSGASGGGAGRPSAGSGGQTSGGGSAKGGSGGTTGGATTGGTATGGTATGGTAAGDAGDGGMAGSTTAGSAGEGGSLGGEGGAPNEGGESGAGEPGGEGGSAGVPNEPTGEALLERPSEARYACSLTRPLELLELPWAQGTLLAGDEPSLIWTSESPVQIAWATLGTDGVLGEPGSLAAAGESWLSWLSAARQGDRITIVWSEAGSEPETNLMLAQVDASGAIVTPPEVLETSDGGQLRPELVAAGDGYALLWSETRESGARLRFARLDADGGLLETPKLLAEGSSVDAGTLIAAGDGFALTYSAFDEEYRTYYLALDADGEPRRSPVPLGAGYVTSASLVARGDRVLAAWTHLHGGYETQEIAINLRIGWFDADGDPRGETYELQRPIVHEQNLEPSWVEVGDDLGLVWAKGGVIYICAGCIPDDHLELVVLDGETLAPVSNVVSLSNGLTNGGLRRPEVVRTGSDLLIVPSITYHVTAEAGSATVRCTE